MPRSATARQTAVQGRSGAWWPLIPILLLALVLRLGYLPLVGFMSDAQWNGRQASEIYRVGLLNMYAKIKDVDYPPVFMAMLGIVGELQVMRGHPIPVPTPVSTFDDS
ncbi:MAG TPA: hypothetical protein VMT34_17375, partial [Aggregatilineales bacterium]|nr:hypothetical protein [Aggregatilineales bacterium]